MSLSQFGRLAQIMKANAAPAAHAGESEHALRVDVVIPARATRRGRSGAWWRDCRRPLLSRVIVVDNGSRERTMEVARRAGAAVVSEPRLGYGWTVEMQACAAHAGLRCVEVPVRHRRRRLGRSKVAGTLGGMLGAGWKIPLTIPRVRLGG